MIIALVSQKGGVGKSTLARLLAVEFAAAGWGVKIADLDAKQGTSTRWQLRRSAAELEPAIDVQAYRDVRRALAEAPRWDLLILDGPAHAERGGLAMAQAADLVLIPTGYSLDDLEAQAEAALDLEAGGVDPGKIRMALCRCRGSAAEDRSARGYLRRAGLVALAASLRELPIIRQAQAGGAAASETRRAKIDSEAAQLAREVAALLTEGKANAEAG